MAQVTVTIDGKSYRMACEEGQEPHLNALAERFDRYVTHLREQFGEIGDLRLTVMAAIMVMDELTEKERKLVRLDEEIAGLRGSQDSVIAEAQAHDGALAGALGDIADQINRLTDRLNGQDSVAVAVN
jgi:cell division protein ZapA